MNLKLATALLLASSTSLWAQHGDHKTAAAPHHSPAPHAASAEVATLVASYEALSAAVFDADLPAIHTQARALASLAQKQHQEAIQKQAEAVAETTEIQAARQAFSKLSAAVIATVDDQPGFYVMECPMFENGIWLQSTAELHNPYMGQRMPKCGVIKHQTGSGE